MISVPPVGETAPPHLYKQLADEVEAQIRAGTYRPGDRIPSVRRLRDQHQVSLTTALGAMRVLEDRGLVRARPQSGHFVREPARAAFAEPGLSSPSSRPRRVDASLAMRRIIAQRGIDTGYSVSPDEIVITSGAKEAVYLSIRAVTRPGDTVAIESPAYYALLEVLASLGLRAVEVPSHPRSGIDTDALATVLRTRPVAAVALVSNFSNPTGSCMTDQAKRRLVELLERHDVPLVEDDVYGELVFEGPRPRAIKAFDRRGLVLYCGSYSKTLSPGLRVGWAIPGRYQDKLELLKLVVNQATATAPQLAVAAFVESGGFDRHLRRVRHMYREQMEATIDAVTRYFPAETKITKPGGGHVLWAELPRGVDALDLYEAAAAAGIRIAPGPMFSPTGGYRNFIRLNTGFPWRPSTERQIERLGQLVAASA